jgi:hypothetical protein
MGAGWLVIQYRAMLSGLPSHIHPPLSRDNTTVRHPEFIGALGVPKKRKTVMHMYKTLVAGVTALSLTLTPAPAAATGSEQDNFGGLIFGLAIAGIIGKLIHDNNTRSLSSSQPLVQHSPAPVPTPTPRAGHRLQPQAPAVQNTRRRDPRVLPSACVQRHATQRGPQRVFSTLCLNERYPYVANLPASCAIRLRTFDGPVRGYDPTCLQTQGYRSDRH